MPTVTVRKRNAQDATREYDVKPVRLRVVKLEKRFGVLSKELQAVVRALKEVGITPRR